jgi:6-pyruvoyltetrahydropterin/6-carboxytetrahydropterin synthase
MIYLTRRERFSAAHRLFRTDWDDDRNREVYGLCSNPNWHGHNYNLYVTVKGKMKPDFGYVVDLKILGMIIRETVTDKLDHRNVNLEVDFMKGRMASTENIAVAIWDELKPHVKKLGVELHCVKIEETENNFVEYYG